ncbi:hypothetical protein [Umezawaea sp. Da 62-37]|uniref:hypothetical protein n=1 Tax=Umezawaea sp. Da 62-37 TaxID=3075927 RepID=UPI0028F6FCFD|nr:hypothetical protein [Umezawaea sp. Da 62-37]WNV89628.1 hypothetical protein RM788_15395 [Umezawaea sp. Da 62-37]
MAHEEDEQRRGGADEPFEGGDDEHHQQQRPQDVREVVGAHEARGEAPPMAVEQVRAAVAGRFAQCRNQARDEAGGTEQARNRNALDHDGNPFPVNAFSSPERGRADIGPRSTRSDPLV